MQVPSSQGQRTLQTVQALARQIAALPAAAAGTLANEETFSVLPSAHWAGLTFAKETQKVPVFTK
jgi:hypothetical protein